MTNYVVTARAFGTYERGSVIPDYIAKLAGDVADLIDRGVVALTTDAVNVEIAAPKKATTTDESALYAANADLTDELAAAKLHAEHAVGRANEAERQLAALKEALAERVTETDRLAKLVAQLQADLEHATAPDPDPK